MILLQSPTTILRPQDNVIFLCLLLQLVNRENKPCLSCHLVSSECVCVLVNVYQAMLLTVCHSYTCHAIVVNIHDKLTSSWLKPTCLFRHHIDLNVHLHVVSALKLEYYYICLSLLEIETVTRFPSNLFMWVKYMSDIEHFMTAPTETANLSVNFPNVDKTKYSKQGVMFLCL